MKKYICSGTKRISVVIQNRSKQYLIVKNSDEDVMEFPGITCQGHKMPEDDVSFVAEELGKVLDVQLDSVKLIEIYYDDSIPWRHYIYRAEILSGSPSKKKYKKIFWKSFDDIKSGEFNVYGRQTLQKIAECTYCHKLCEKKAELDIFFDEYMAHDAGRLVSNVISQAGESDDVYKMAIRYYFSHLRAWLVESPNLKKNRTVQNYLILYERQDLLEEVNQVLELNITEEWTLKHLIKSYVDMNIAHYDRATEDTRKIVEYCNTVFGKNGSFPIDEFVGIMESYMMSLIIEMWFYAGELGADIGNPDPSVAVLLDVNRRGLLDTMRKRFHETNRQKTNV